MVNIKVTLMGEFAKYSTQGIKNLEDFINNTSFSLSILGFFPLSSAFVVCLLFCQC